MLRDELLRHLVMLPADAEVVIDVGRIQVEVVDIAGIQYPGEREVIALKPHPDDLRDAFAAQGRAAEEGVNRQPARGGGRPVPAVFGVEGFSG